MSIILGIEGHNDAGTNENEMPSKMIAANATILLGNAGNTTAKVRWQIIISNEPRMSIVAPLPFLSRNQPRSGVMQAAPIGNQRKMSAAVVASRPRLLCNILAANFWNGKIAEYYNTHNIATIQNNLLLKIFTTSENLNSSSLSP